MRPSFRPGALRHRSLCELTGQAQHAEPESAQATVEDSVAFLVLVLHDAVEDAYAQARARVVDYEAHGLALLVRAVLDPAERADPPCAAAAVHRADAVVGAGCLGRRVRRLEVDDVCG